MTTNSLPSSHLSRAVAALLAFGVLAGVAVSNSVSAATPTKVTWNVSSLAPGESRNLWAVVSTNSSGVKTWSKKGTCTLTPTRKPTKLTMGTTGLCELTLKIAKSKNYPARTLRKTVTLTALTTTVMPKTTVTPVTTIATARTVVFTSTIAPATTIAPAMPIASTTTLAPTTTLASMCVTGGTCAVGTAGPGGGTVFYVASSDFTSTGSACDTTCRYLEVAPIGWITAPTPVGQTNCSTPGTSLNDPKCEWSGNTTSVLETGAGVGEGYASTSTMITQSGTAGKAATVARAFQGGGKTDWFLPSREELNELCKWAYNDTVNVICNDEGYGGLSLTNGGFVPDLYWSSTTYDRGLAWYQYFNYFSGRKWAGGKNNAYYVRPVRAF